jgi:hypothetical protein
MRDALLPAIASANVLFQQPAADGVSSHVSVHHEFIENYLRRLAAMRSELRALEEDQGVARQCWRSCPPRPTPPITLTLLSSTREAARCRNS